MIQNVIFFLARYDRWRQKEHLQKLKDKYGEEGEEGERKGAANGGQSKTKWARFVRRNRLGGQLLELVSFRKVVAVKVFELQSWLATWFFIKIDFVNRFAGMQKSFQRNHQMGETLCLLLMTGEKLLLS